jgi:hypothetical protein
VREGLEETLTLQGLGIEGTLYRKLRSTNAIENLNSGIAAYSKNVKRWKGGSLRRYRELPPLCSLELTRRPSCSR